MQYTSYTVSGGAGLSDQKRLQMRIDAASRSGRDVYILAIERGDLTAARVAEMCKHVLPQVARAIDVNGTIDIVTTGTSEEAERAAKVLHDCTQQKVGYVRYDKGKRDAYLDLGAALYLADRLGEDVHLFDPTNDSPSAMNDRRPID